MNSVQLFQLPELCPVCSGSLQIDGDFLYCRSKSCPAKLSGSVKVWVKRLGLLHWGDAFIDALTDPDSPKVASIADLYRLSIDELAECCSGQKLAKKCYDILHSNKDVTLELLLASLNIPNLAIATATDIVQAGHDTIEKILSLSYEDLLKVPNIGEVTARQIFDSLKERSDAISELVLVLNIKKPGLGKLKNKSFCITGATQKPRKALQKIVLDNGGVVKDSVGQGLTYLITNEGSEFNSSKMQKAKKLGVVIITEENFLDMIKSTI